MSAGSGYMRCIRPECGGTLGQSGQEVYRMVCGHCGQNYFVRLVIEPVAPKETPNLLPGSDAEFGGRSE